MRIESVDSGRHINVVTRPGAGQVAAVDWNNCENYSRKNEGKEREDRWRRAGGVRRII